MSGGASTGPKSGAPRRIHSILAIAAVLFLLLAGATAAYLSRPSEPTSQPHRTRPIVLAEAPKQTADRPAPPSAQPGHSRRTVTLAGPGRISEAIADLGVDTPQVARLTNQVLEYIGPSPGELRLTADLARSAEGQLSLSWLEVSRVDGAGVRLLAKGKDFEPEKLAARLTTRTIAVRGEMGTTFYNSAVEAGVDDSLISDFAAAFNYDVDFQFELHQGDIFEGTFEQDYNPWGESVGARC